MTGRKSLKIQDFKDIISQKKEPAKAFIPTNYLSDTDPEEYQDYPKLLNMTR